MEMHDSEFQESIDVYELVLPKKVEFRLYYNDDGSIICYSCEDLEGNYIVIDAKTYAECRQDIRVIDNKIEVIKSVVLVRKLVEATQGTKCAIEDINIIASSEYKGKTTFWEIKIYEPK